MKFDIVVSVAILLLALQVNARLQPALRSGVLGNLLWLSTSVQGEAITTSVPTKIPASPIYVLDSVLVPSPSVIGGMNQGLIEVGSGSVRLLQTTITSAASPPISSYTGDLTDTMFVIVPSGNRDTIESATELQAPNTISAASAAATTCSTMTEVETTVINVLEIEELIASSSLAGAGFGTSSVASTVITYSGSGEFQGNTGTSVVQGKTTVLLGTQIATVTAIVAAITIGRLISTKESSLLTPVTLSTIIPAGSESQSNVRAGPIIIVPTLSGNSLGVPTIIPSGIEVSESNDSSNVGSAETVILISSFAIGTSTIAASGVSMMETLVSMVYSAIPITTVGAPSNTWLFQSTTTLNRNSSFLTTFATNTPTGVNTETLTFSSHVPIASLQSPIPVFTVTNVLQADGTSVPDNGSATDWNGSNGSVSGDMGGSAPVPIFDFTSSETYLVPSATRSPVRTGKATKLEGTACVGLVVVIAALL